MILILSVAGVLSDALVCTGLLAAADHLRKAALAGLNSVSAGKRAVGERALHWSKLDKNGTNEYRKLPGAPVVWLAASFDRAEIAERRTNFYAASNN